MKKIKSNYLDLNIDTDVLIVDPPWDYEDKLDGINTLQTSYNRWNNKEGLEWLFSQKVDYLFIWTTNSMLYDVLRAEHKNFIYKQCITWIKQTSKGNLMYGLGNNFRNSTEQILLFVKKGCKPLRLNIRNLIFAKTGKRTIKPKVWESELIRMLNERNKTVSYVFSGPNVDLFTQFDNLRCYDICFDTINEI